MATSIEENLTQVLQAIRVAEQSANRLHGEVTLLVVTKQQRVEDIVRLIACGQYRFGENYLQEALDKMAALAHYPLLEWHFIGRIQRNKTRLIAQHFNWVHSVSDLIIAQRLSAQRPDHLPVLNICIQVNIDGAPNKAGIILSELTHLATAIVKLPHLKLRGLMAIPEPHHSPQSFIKMRLAYEELQILGFTLDTLSMGMTQDYEEAIAEGANLVRIGTAIFGTRQQ